MENQKETTAPANDKKLEPWEITPEEKAQYEAKCIELAAKYGVPKVYPCVLFKHNDPTCERLVAFIKEPNYISKLAAMDKASTMGIHLAAEDLRLVNQIVEESHPWTCSDLAEFERYKLGVAQFCIGIIDISMNHLKKN